MRLYQKMIEIYQEKPNSENQCIKKKYGELKLALKKKKKKKRISTHAFLLPANAGR